MEKITGNFLTQANKDFPLDCETMDYLQKLAVLSAMVGNIGGDRIVLCGCEANNDGTQRNPGYVFLRTTEAPEGEVLPWEGGTTTGGMYLKREDISVMANNVSYPKAYVRRSLAPGIGDENFDWDSFKDILTIRDLMNENETLRSKLELIKPAPLGVVQLWSGAGVPENYALCDGRSLRISDYPDLYESLGSIYNHACDANGNTYSTEEGFFRIPDLRGRFVVGGSDIDVDYKVNGKTGGLKAVALKISEMPSHEHSFKDYYHSESEKKVTGNYDQLETNNKIGSNGSDYDNSYLQWVKHKTEKEGSGESHENRPPYYVLSYIMRIK